MVWLYSRMDFFFLFRKEVCGRLRLLLLEVLRACFDEVKHVIVDGLVWFYV
jgi:hypothetical protein